MGRVLLAYVSAGLCALSLSATPSQSTAPPAPWPWPTAPPGPADWPAFPNRSCHAPTPSARVIDIDNTTHAQCAAACAAKGCHCFDMDADGTGSCRGTVDVLFRDSHDRTAYANTTAPSPPRPPAPPRPTPAAPFSLHPLLGDNVVLQRAPARAAIYGWATTAGASITVHFRGEAYSGTAAGNDTGLGALMWRVELPPTPRTAMAGETIVVTGLGMTVTLANVLFGDGKC